MLFASIGSDEAMLKERLSNGRGCNSMFFLRGLWFPTKAWIYYYDNLRTGQS